MMRVTLSGAELDGFALADPAASVRLLFPPPGARDVVMPAWNGNEFLLADGRRPAIRTLTPRSFDAAALELDLDVVDHGTGTASTWATTAEVGSLAAMSGPGRGYTINREAAAFVLGGDETAIPAISQLLESLPAEAAVHVCIEVAEPHGRLELPEHPRATVEWCDLPNGAPPGDALVTAVRSVELVPDARVWVAGEAAAVQRIRRYLFEERGMARSQTSVRGYWKHGRAGDTDDA
jgi:NADPH-dependent ferric siderophore reductase